MPPTSGPLSFADFAFDPSEGRLWRGGRPVPLERQPAAVLGALLATPGQLVTRQEIANIVWGAAGTHVKVDDSLNYCISQIRAALEDDAREPRFVTTIPRRGYRFVAQVTGPAPRPSAGARRMLVYGAAMAVLLLTVLIESRPNNHHELAASALRAIHDLIY